VPYTTDSPPASLKNQPKGLIRIWVDTFNAVLKETNDETQARQGAWRNVKLKYQKVGEKWVRKGDIDIGFAITKASIDNQGIMRFSCTATDTAPDKNGDRTSVSLYEDFIEYAEKYGMPYVSISHYSREAADAGQIESLYIDGRCFKGKGIFADNPIGKAAFHTIKQDRRDGVPADKQVRISIGFFDFAHAHGDEVFVRESLDESCPICEKDASGREFLHGKLEHLALTRVPMNPRTPIELEEKSMAVTRKSDAASIVTADLAEEIDHREREKSVHKSDTDGLELVERAEGDVPASVVAEPAPAETTTSVVLQSVVPQDTTGVVNPAVALPFNGATSLKEIEDYLEAEDEAWRLQDTWRMLQSVISNIFDSKCDKPKDKIKAAVDEFKSKIEVKALVAMSQLERPEVPMDKFFKALSDAVALAKSKPTEAERLTAVQPALNELAEAIRLELAPKPEGQPSAPSSELADLKAFLVQELGTVRSEIAAVKASQIQAPRQPAPPVPQRAAINPMAYPQLSRATPKANSLEEQVWRSVQ